MPPRRRAFTLLEVVLAIFVLSLLMGALVLNFAGMGRDGRLQEGAMRVETTLRMARADAAMRSRRIRLAADADGRLRVEWEPDPLGAPGGFAPYSGNAAASAESAAAAGARVLRCDATGPRRSLVRGEGLLFEPDGSSDSGVVVVAGDRAGDTRRITLVLNGVTGTITSRTLTLAEGEQ